MIALLNQGMSVEMLLDLISRRLEARNLLDLNHVA